MPLFIIISAILQLRALPIVYAESSPNSTKLRKTRKTEALNFIGKVIPLLKMSRFNSMPMPPPVGSSNYGPPPSSNYGPTSYAPYPAADTTMTNDGAVDKEMNTLIDNLKISIQDASAEELDTLLKNEDSLNTLIEDSPQVRSKNKSDCHWNQSGIF